MLQDFKKFILRGNVVDLAVAVVIGAAFTAIVEQGGLPPEYPTLAAQPNDRDLQICARRLG